MAKKYKRKEVEDLLKRKFFVVPSFEIYGGAAGFFDFGPLGAALKQHVEALWRQHFVLEEDMLELSTANITVEDVFKASGHVDKFQDHMVKDVKTGTCRRADKLIAEHVAKILPKKKNAEEVARLERVLMECEEYSCAQLDAAISELGIRDPDTGNALSAATPFNLMFGMPIGPSGYMHGYLRPETAQGIFINFRRLIEFNNGRMPFAAAQLGTGFRNEISPRQGLLRVREFQLAEIEHFCDPQNKSHPKIASVHHLRLPLFSAEAQEAAVKEASTALTVEEALAQGVFRNETMAYFVARTYLFLTAVGVKAEAVRFRQHRANEMAHYANDCWDAEVETSYGWIEVAGHSDRSAFDLERHMGMTKTELMAARPLKTPLQVTSTVVTLDKKVLGKEFKKDQVHIVRFFDEADNEAKAALAAEFAERGQATVTCENGQQFTLLPQHVAFSEQTKTMMEEKYVPHVIEPSFGIGRIVYCIFEHCF